MLGERPLIDGFTSAGNGYPHTEQRSKLPSQAHAALAVGSSCLSVCGMISQFAKGSVLSLKVNLPTALKFSVFVGFRTDADGLFL